MTASGLLIAGTSSDAGKSLVVTGLCRLLSRNGISVAPFKSQNMSNNSMVCADGSEIGRAQYLQALAARIEPDSSMNPVLLKPGSDRRSHVVLRGQPHGELHAGEYATGRRHLADAAYAAYRELAERVEVIICEGAGSPAEINLRSGDYVNLGLAREFRLPVLVVGDIDRGGVLASLYGTVALLDPEDRAMIKGFLINKFRGDQSVLDPGLAEISKRTGVPFFGVLPWLDGVWLDGEDALEVGRRWRTATATSETAAPNLRVAVIRLPRISNATDVDALAAEPGVEVAVTTHPDVVAGADLVVLPGSRATLSDLAWLCRSGLDVVLTDRRRRGAPTLGICGGFQMMAESIDDTVESGDGLVSGLGLLPTKIGFSSEKHLGRPTGEWKNIRVDGYEIHHGVASLTADVDQTEPFLDGWRRGPVWGTMWHGTLENDQFRRAWLTEVAAATDSRWQPHPDAPSFADRRETMINTMADAIEVHVDVERLMTQIRAGA